MLGIEPNLKWRAFCDDVVAVARTTGCEIVVTLGALLGDTPHSRPVRCTGSATDEVLAARLGMQRSRYEGPTGIVGVLHDAVREVGFASASIWAPVPHYVATPPNPKATRALLDQLGESARPATSTSPTSTSRRPRGNARSPTSSRRDPDVSAYVARLEARYDDSRRRPGMPRDDDDETKTKTTTTSSTRTTSRRATRSPKTSSATSATRATSSALTSATSHVRT